MSHDPCFEVDIFVTIPIQTRTQVVSFLFMDLVAFSKESTASQHQIKTVLIQRLTAALAPIPVDEYRLRDTGDGAFIAFWSNPEFALYTALVLWQACDTEGAETALTRQRLRVGLHIGTVKEAADVEGRTNYVGDGINAAKRIQDLAKPGQMLASRSFFDAFDHLDTDYASLFTPCGSGNDKHGRSYELFALTYGDAALAKLSKEIAQNTTRSRDAIAAKQKAPEHPLSQVSDFITTWFMPVNAVLVFVTFYVSYFGKLAEPASVMHYTGVLLLILTLLMSLASLWLKSTQRAHLSVRHPKWVAFLNHKPITWLSLGLGVTLLVASYFVKEQTAPPKEPALVQSSAKAVPVFPIVTSAPAPDAAKPAAVESHPKSASVDSGASPAIHPLVKARTTSGIRANSELHASRDKPPSKASSTNPRCTSLLQKAGTGEPLSQQEKKEMVSVCQ